MDVIETDLPGVVLINPNIHEDARGHFFQAWHAGEFAAAGLNLTFVQDNQSRSAKGVIRGLHYQLEQAQGKLVRVIVGRAFDVAVDLRRSSSSFGRWIGVELSAKNRRLLWVPPGFAHGFLALEDDTDLIYKCTDFYAPAHERTLLWSDPALGINWPLQGLAPIVAMKDQAGAQLAQADLYP